MKKRFLRSELVSLADSLEAEMKRIGIWSDKDLSAVSPDGAFGGNSLTFEEWLQATLLPRLRSVDGAGHHPKASHLATAAVRNSDGFDNTSGVIEILSRIDTLVNNDVPHQG